MKNTLKFWWYHWIHRKNELFNNFSESTVLILNYQLPFFQSGWFPGKMNWTGAQLYLEFIQCCWSLKWITKLKYALAQGLFMESWSENEKHSAWRWSILVWCLVEWIWFFKNFSGTIRIGMHRLIFVSSTFEMCRLEVPDLEYIKSFSGKIVTAKIPCRGMCQNGKRFIWRRCV